MINLKLEKILETTLGLKQVFQLGAQNGKKQKHVDVYC